MEEKNISQEVLDKIKEVKPKPRWHFLLKNYFVWLLACLALIISSLSFAAVLYMLIDNDWDVYSRISGSLLEFIFVTFPYFWLLFLGIFIFVFYYNFRHTNKGYKYPLSQVFLASLGINILLGSFLYVAGVGQALDNIVARQVPFYEKIINQRKNIWTKVDKGFLGGVVVDMDDEYIVVQDIEGNIWQIKHFNTTTPGFVSLEIGQPVRIVGEKIDSQYFEMHMILPMRGMKWIEDRRMLPSPRLLNERNF